MFYTIFILGGVSSHNNNFGSSLMYLIPEEQKEID